MADEEDQRKFRELATRAVDRMQALAAHRIALKNAIDEAGVEEIDGPLSVVIQDFLVASMSIIEMLRLVSPLTDEDHLLAFLRAANRYKKTPEE